MAQREDQLGKKTEEGAADLFEDLRRDHQEIRHLFQRIEKTDPARLAERKELFSILEQHLVAHLEAEERFLYTALEQTEAARHSVLVSYEEHQVARLLLSSFNSLAGDDARWPAKLSVLQSLLERHMLAEERELFELGREVLTRQQLEVIAQKVQEVKRDPKRPEATKEAG